jgi:hypothetical protein
MDKHLKFIVSSAAVGIEGYDAIRNLWWKLLVEHHQNTEIGARISALMLEHGAAAVQSALLSVDPDANFEDAARTALDDVARSCYRPMEHMHHDGGYVVEAVPASQDSCWPGDGPAHDDDCTEAGKLIDMLSIAFGGRSQLPDAVIGLAIRGRINNAGLSEQDGLTLARECAHEVEIRWTDDRTGEITPGLDESSVLSGILGAMRKEDVIIAYWDGAR